MLNFFDTNKRTLPQQVQKNKEDIKNLQEANLSQIKEFNFTQNKDGIIYSNNKVSLTGILEIVRENMQDNQFVQALIEFLLASGDNNIIIDVSEDNQKLQIKLSKETDDILIFAKGENDRVTTEGEIVHNSQLNDFSLIPSGNTILNIFDFETVKDHRYTAPANGYVFVYFVSNNSSVPDDLFLSNETSGLEFTFARKTNTSCFVPCKKGDIINFYTSGIGNINYCQSKFIYARNL